jgi:hypothetical protein
MSSGGDDLHGCLGCLIWGGVAVLGGVSPFALEYLLRDTVLAGLPFEIVIIASGFLLLALGSLALNAFNRLAELVEDWQLGCEAMTATAGPLAPHPTTQPTPLPIAEEISQSRPPRRSRPPSPPRTDPPREQAHVDVCRGTLSRVGPVAWYCDECANGLALPLRRHGLDVLTSREAGMDGTRDDREQLLFAQRQRRILITYNVKDFRRLDGVIPHAGMVLCPQGKEYVQEIVRVCLRIAEHGLEPAPLHDEAR